MSISKKQQLLLDWFDKNRRVMPWRAPKGRRPDPYHVWLSEIMLQQTTVAAVGPYFLKFVQKWPTVKKLARARLDDVLAAWAGLGYYARARNLHKCAGAVARRGSFPDTVADLLELPGVGPYTAAAIASIAFDVPATAVDGNVERVVSRYFAIEEPLPLSKPQIRQKAEKLARGAERPGDFTQAFMELGATVCTPKNPKCGICPWKTDCLARKKGIAADLPGKMAKSKKPVRFGRVYWVRRADGKFLIHKRKGQGLYESMYQLPTTEWVDSRARRNAAALFKPAQPLNAEVRHSFTHFDLILDIWKCTPSSAKTALVEKKWVSLHEINDFALPSLMKKVIRMASRSV